MKKTTGICCTVFLAVLGITGLFFLFQPKKGEPIKEMRLAAETEKEESEKSAESMKVQDSYAYMICEKDGILVVYEWDGKTVYFETNIRMDSLDAAMQEKVKLGIQFPGEKELYDFLESYSS